jgi:small GTP-binding protein
MDMKEMIRKICMLGDPSVGKTSLVRRFVLDVFDDKYIPSIGMKVTKKHIVLKKDSLDLTLMIWDILGSKTTRFDSVYYKGVKGAILVSDVTRENTMDNLSKWISGLFEITGEVPVITLVNKVDLKKTKKSFQKKMDKFCDDYGAKSHFTSAKTGENVEEAFLNLADRMVIRKPEE